VNVALVASLTHVKRAPMKDCGGACCARPHHCFGIHPARSVQALADIARERHLPRSVHVVPSCLRDTRAACRLIKRFRYPSKHAIMHARLHKPATTHALGTAIPPPRLVLPWLRIAAANGPAAGVLAPASEPASRDLEHSPSRSLDL